LGLRPDPLEKLTALPWISGLTSKGEERRGERDRGRKGKKGGKGRVSLLRSPVPLQLAAAADASGPYAAWDGREEKGMPVPLQRKCSGSATAAYPIIPCKN